MQINDVNISFKNERFFNAWCGCNGVMGEFLVFIMMTKKA